MLSDQVSRGRLPPPAGTWSCQNMTFFDIQIRERCVTLQRVHSSDILSEMEKFTARRCRLRITEQKIRFSELKKTARWSLIKSSGRQRHIRTERCRVSKRFSIRFIHPLLFNQIEINILIRASSKENWTGSNLWLPFGNGSGKKWFRFRRKWSMSTPKRFLSAVDQLLRLGFIKIYRNSGSSKTFSCLLRPTWNFLPCRRQ